MRFLRKTLLVTLIVTSMMTFAPPKAQAFLDPVTIAILAPIAIKVAEYMRPYVQRGLISGGKATLEMLVDVFKILYLPLGVIESTLGAPFGLFSSGIGHVGKGLCAPFIVVFDCVMLPVKFMGISGG